MLLLYETDRNTTQACRSSLVSFLPSLRDLSLDHYRTATERPSQMTTLETNSHCHAAISTQRNGTSCARQ